MDKLSRKILKYVYRNPKVKRKTIIEKFGNDANKCIDYLYNEKYITSNHIPVGVGPNMRPVLMSDGLYSISPSGISELEQQPGKTFDKWLTRILAIIGAVTGTISLIVDIMQWYQSTH